MCIATVVHAQSTPKPWDEHGALKVSKNGHYIQHADGTPFLWIGGTAWAMFTRGSREDVQLYVDNRKAKGVNVVQAVAHWPVDALGTGRELGNKNPVNVYGHRPFNGGVDNPDPTSPAVVSGGSPDSPNDFWDHADFIVRELRNRGMYLALVTVWAPSMIDGRDGVEKIVYDTQSKSRSFGEFLGSRYKNEPHIIWIVTGHTNPDDYNETIDSRPIHRAMAEGIVNGVTGQTVAWNQNHSAWDQVLMTGHPHGERSISHFFGGNDVWLDFNMSQTGQYNTSLHLPYALTVSDCNLTNPVRPAVNGEGAYEGWAYWAPENIAFKSPLLARRTFYHTFFAGGAGYTYGHEESGYSGCYDSVWGFCGPNNDGSWKSLLDSPGAGDLPHLRNLLNDNEWWKWQRSQGSITSGKSSGATIKAAVKSTDNSRMLVYYPERNSATIRNDLGGSATASWFDPRNGNTTGAGSFKINQSRALTPPNGWEDAVLILDSLYGEDK
jgi:hypothetical protein